MKEKARALLTCTIIAMGICGFVYAQWNDVIIVRNTMRFGDLNMGFVEPLKCWDNEATKEVGKYDCYYADPKVDTDTGKEANATLVIAINNAYPSYEVHCNYTLENIGTLPLHINETVIFDPTGVLTWNATLNALVDAVGKPIVTIAITPPLVSNVLEPEDNSTTPWLDNKAEFEMTIHITQNAEECHVYTFQVKIMYEVVQV